MRPVAFVLGNIKVLETGRNCALLSTIVAAFLPVSGHKCICQAGVACVGTYFFFASIQVIFQVLTHYFPLCILASESLSLVEEASLYQTLRAETHH